MTDMRTRAQALADTALELHNNIQINPGNAEIMIKSALQKTWDEALHKLDSKIESYKAYMEAAYHKNNNDIALQKYNAACSIQEFLKETLGSPR